MATYNLVSVPVVDDAHRLVGVVTIDDVLDHVLPDDWRSQDPEPDPSAAPAPRARTRPLTTTTGRTTQEAPNGWHRDNRSDGPPRLAEGPAHPRAARPAAAAARRPLRARDRGASPARMGTP